MNSLLNKKPVENMGIGMMCSCFIVSVTLLAAVFQTSHVVVFEQHIWEEHKQ